MVIKHSDSWEKTRETLNKAKSNFQLSPGKTNAAKKGHSAQNLLERKEMSFKNPDLLNSEGNNESLSDDDES